MINQIHIAHLIVLSLISALFMNTLLNGKPR
jgi:hypothetical protein